MKKNRLEAFSDGVSAICRVNHPLIFQKVQTVNVKILRCNIGWIFVMSLIPFVTARVGSYLTPWMPHWAGSARWWQYRGGSRYLLMDFYNNTNRL